MLSLQLIRSENIEYMTIKHHFISFFAATTLLLLTIPAVAEEDIVIGVIAGLTGSGTSYGTSIVQGAEMAVDEVNAEGGINGRKLKLRIVDDSSDPARSAIMMRRLVASSPDMIIGGWGSAQVLAHLEFAEYATIPYIIVGATNPQIISAKDRWIFRVIQSDDRIAEQLAKQTLTHGMNRIAILFDRNAYGRGNRDTFIAALKGLGHTPVMLQSYRTTDKNFHTQLTKIKASKPDGIAIFGTVPAAPMIMKQARELGIKARFIGTGGLANRALITAAGASAEGTLLMSTFHKDVDARAVDWSKRYYSRYQNSKTLNPAGAVIEYAAIKDIVVPCLQSVGSNHLKLRDCIASWYGKFVGLLADSSFDKTGQLISPPITVEIRDGTFHLLRSVP